MPQGRSLGKRHDGELLCQSKIEWEDQTYKTREEAKTDIFKYIETSHKPIRRHSSLGNISPVECKRRYETGELTDLAA